MFLGTDITEVKRIAYLAKHYEKKFLNKIYSRKEINYCYSRKHPYIHLSGIFSAKESVKKSIYSSNLLKSIPFNLIEIKHLKNGAPYVDIKKSLNKIKSINISISHTREFATSVALLISR